MRLRQFMISALLFMSLTPMLYAENPKVIAHRGASGYLPEHTLPAIAMAHSFGVDYIEADLVMTKDNVLVVMHDHSLNTSTDVAKKFPARKRADGGYYVIDFTLAEVKTLIVHERTNNEMNASVFDKRFPAGDIVEFRVPTFDEFIVLIQGLNKSRNKNIGIYPEVKEPAFHEKEGKKIMEATIDMLTKYGYNKENGNGTLQIFDFDAVKKARKLGWKGNLAMLVDSEGQGLIDDKKIHAWLMSEEGIKEASKYANYYAPWLGEIVVPNTKAKGGYDIKPILDIARKYKMKTTTWTHRADSPLRPFKTSDEMLDVVFKKLKFDELFSDQSDVVISYLQINKLR